MLYHKYLAVNIYKYSKLEIYEPITLHTNQRTKHRVPQETLAFKEKCDDVKTAYLCNRRNPNNTNAQKIKKAQSKLNNTYIKE